MRDYKPEGRKEEGVRDAPATATGARVSLMTGAATRQPANPDYILRIHSF